jgi:nicotinamide mononucleotide (NMN) deamidase PncC
VVRTAAAAMAAVVEEEVVLEMAMAAEGRVGPGCTPPREGGTFYPLRSTYTGELRLLH